MSMHEGKIPNSIFMIYLVKTSSLKNEVEFVPHQGNFYVAHIFFHGSKNCACDENISHL